MNNSPKTTRPIVPPSQNKISPIQLRTLSILFIFVVIGAYLALALLLNLWPFQRSVVAPEADMRPTPQISEDTAPSTSPTPNISNWQTYRNSAFHFSLRYPSNLRIDKLTGAPFDFTPLTYVRLIDNKGDTIHIALLTKEQSLIPFSDANAKIIKTLADPTGKEFYLAFYLAFYLSVPQVLDPKDSEAIYATFSTIAGSLQFN